MAPARKRSPVTAPISQPVLSQVSSTLESLPEKPKEFWSLRETIAQLQEPITVALDRGYSYEEIAKILADHDIAISVFSLKRYLSMSRTQANAGSGRGQGRRKPRGSRKATEADSTPEPEVAPVETPAEPAAKKRGGGRAKAEPTTAAKAKSTGRTRGTAQRGRRSTKAKG